jgi:hypothetical protein
MEDFPISAPSIWIGHLAITLPYLPPFRQAPDLITLSMARNGGYQAVGRAGSCFLDNSLHYVDQSFSFGKYKMAVYFY